MDRSKSTTENTSYVQLSAQRALLGDAAHTMTVQRSRDSSEVINPI